MLRIAFNDAKETVHTASWPLKGLYSSTGKKKAHSSAGCIFPLPREAPRLPSPKSGRSSALTLPHQWCWKRPSTEPPRFLRKKASGERLEWGKGDSHARDHDCWKAFSRGCLSDTVWKSPNCFLPTQYLYFLLRAWLGSVFSAQIINNQETVSRICSVASIPNSSFKTKSDEYARDKPPDQQCNLN